ncbi:MAG: phytoene desaturase [Fimbriimonadaceae bacterium]|nr:phytoene desaturase [Fimbriimonadaceae bacterium]
MSKKIVIIGAGLGGLAAGLRLAHAGHEVAIYEKTDQIGGRNRAEQVHDCHFDAGPTLMMMLDPFRKLYSDVGERMEDHLRLSLCDPSYRVFYSDGVRFQATPNVARMVEQIRELSPRDARAYPKLLGDLAALYKDSIPNFVEKNYNSPLDFFGPSSLAKVVRHRMLANLSKRIAKYIEHPKLRMLFSFQTMYLGLSPFESPWVYATLIYMEFGEGIWYPQGGVVEIARSIARLAEARGVKIHRNSPVSSIQGRLVMLESGESVEADVILCNADLPYAERELVRSPGKAPKSGKLKSSCSAFMIYCDYEGSLPELRHHNVFFGSDFADNQDCIFNRRLLPEDPAFYVCISKRSEASVAPEGHENLMVLVPCPNLDRPWSDQDAVELREKVYGRLGREVGFEPSRVRGVKTWSPEVWRSALNLDRGAAFGLSHHFNQSAYFRPANRSKSNPNLYFVGASTIPGNGMPMVLISADLAVQRILEGVGDRA